MTRDELIRKVRGAIGESNANVFLNVLQDEGYVIVPVEPTLAQYDALADEWPENVSGDILKRAYKAMIEAGRVK